VDHSTIGGLNHTVDLVLAAVGPLEQLSFGWTQGPVGSSVALLQLPGRVHVQPAVVVTRRGLPTMVAGAGLSAAISS